MIARALLGIRRNVADLARTVAFYEAALGFEPVTGAATPRMRYGAQTIEFAELAGAAYPVGSTAADLWFQHIAIVTDDIAAAYARLAAYGVTAISAQGPQRLPPSSGGATAFKFRDPEGHPLELIQFAGAPRARGIDHSAISVADAARSIAFYDGLGLTVAQRQVNTGPEQDRLDGLPGVHVEVVALQPPTAAPHLELLCYAAPRARPSQVGAGDIAASRLVFLVDTVAPGPPQQDPDGHWLMFVTQ